MKGSGRKGNEMGMGSRLGMMDRSTRALGSGMNLREKEFISCLVAKATVELGLPMRCMARASTAGLMVASSRASS